MINLLFVPVMSAMAVFPRIHVSLLSGLNPQRLTILLILLLWCLTISAKIGVMNIQSDHIGGGIGRSSVVRLRNTRGPNSNGNIKKLSINMGRRMSSSPQESELLRPRRSYTLR